MANTSVAARRLGPLLQKIREGLRQALDSIPASPDRDGGELPSIHVDSRDIATAALYLRDLGLKYDAVRLRAEWDQCVSGCVGEWLAEVAQEESQEFRDWLTETFGAFPGRVGPGGRATSDRRAMLAGRVARLAELVDELIGTANAIARPPAPEAPADSIGFFGGEDLATVLGIDPSRREAFFKQLERKRLDLGDDGWHEVRDPRSNSPRFLYRVDSPKIRELAAAYTRPKST